MLGIDAGISVQPRGFGASPVGRQLGNNSVDTDASYVAITVTYLVRILALRFAGGRPSFFFQCLVFGRLPGSLFFIQ